MQAGVLAEGFQFSDVKQQSSVGTNVAFNLVNQSKASCIYSQMNKSVSSKTTQTSSEEDQFQNNGYMFEIPNFHFFPPSSTINYFKKITILDLKKF